MIYFTSDQHFYHTNVIRYCNRPFATVEEMNEKLVQLWNETVAYNDEVYCLGDFSMAWRPVELFIKRLNGYKMLVPGNHDFCHSVHKKSRHKENQDKWKRMYEEQGWKVLEEDNTLQIPGVANFNLSHLPYKGDHVEAGERYTAQRMKDDGRWLLCGHVHNHWKMKDKMINVGVDVWNYKPVSLDQILALMTQYPDGANLDGQGNIRV